MSAIKPIRVLVVASSQEEYDAWAHGSGLNPNGQMVDYWRSQYFDESGRLYTGWIPLLKRMDDTELLVWQHYNTLYFQELIILVGFTVQAPGRLLEALKEMFP